jgi:predicted phage tail protein
MTVINLHGILAHEFGDSFLMHVKKPKQAIEAIDANKTSFKKRIFDLSQQGIHYVILVDGENVNCHEQLEIKKENTTIDILPMICGSGFVAALTALGGFLVTAGGAGSALAAVGGLFAATASGASVLSTIIGGALNIIATTLIQQALSPSQGAPERTESTISGAKESFLIGSKANLAQQGNPIPVAYGRLRVGSSVIQTTVKSYPQAYKSKKSLLGKSGNLQDASIREQNSPKL